MARTVKTKNAGDVRDVYYNDLPRVREDLKKRFITIDCSQSNRWTFLCGVYMTMDFL